MQTGDLSTLIAQRLGTKIEDSDEALIINLFHIFTICIGDGIESIAIVQGLEQLATASAGWIYRTLYRLMVTNPTSSVLEYIHRRYHKVAPYWNDFTGLPSRYTMIMIHTLIKGDWSPPCIWRSDDRPPDGEHICFAQDVAELAWAEYQWEHKVPGWIWSFVFDSLSLDPLPSTSIVADCLKVIAMGLGCKTAAFDEMYVCLSVISTLFLTRISVRPEVVLDLISRKLETMAGHNRAPAISKCEAIRALIPYAIFLEQQGQEMVPDAIMRVVRASKDYYFMSSITSYITTLFGKPTSHFRDWLIVLVAPFAEWEDEVHGEDTVSKWAAAASAVHDTASEEVIRSVVGTLMRITNIGSLRPYIPNKIWAWIKKWQTLPLMDQGRFYETPLDTVYYIRGRGDLEIFKLYLLAWLVWYFPSAGDFRKVEDLVKMDFNGTGMDFTGIWMWRHRKDLLDLLGRVPREMVVGRNGEGLKRYGRLRQVLLDMDIQAEDELDCKPQIISSERVTDFCAQIWGLIPPSYVLCPFSVRDHLGRFVLLLWPYLVVSSLSVPRLIAFLHSPFAIFVPFARTWRGSSLRFSTLLIPTSLDRFPHPLVYGNRL